MKALVVKPGKEGVELKDLQIEEENLVKVRTLFTGICGTDREIVGNKLKFVRSEKGEYLVLGHEGLGIVEKSLEGSALKEGDLVVPMVRRPGNCIMCKVGRQDYCIDGNFVEAGIRGKNGFMREYFYEKEEFLVKVDEEIKNIAVLVEPLKNVMKIKETYEFLKNRTIWNCEDSTLSCKGVWVFGTGAEGLLISTVFKDIGFNVTIVNRHPVDEKIMKFLDKNKINFFNSSKDDWNRALKDNPMDLAIDAAGTADIFETCVNFLNNNGIFIFFGTRSTGKIENGEFITKIVDKNLSLAGCEDGCKKHYVEAAKFLKDHGIEYSLKDIITGIFKPEDIWLFKEKPQEEIKSVIKWD